MLKMLSLNKGPKARRAYKAEAPAAIDLHLQADGRYLATPTPIKTGVKVTVDGKTAPDAKYTLTDESIIEVRWGVIISIGTPPQK
jgi:hypothetical protein